MLSYETKECVLNFNNDGDYPQTPEPDNDDHTCNDKGNAEGFLPNEWGTENYVTQVWKI